MTAKPLVVLTHPVHDDVRQRLEAVAELRINPRIEPWTRAELIDHLRDADVMMGFMTDRVDAALLAQAPKLRLVACALKGFDNYDVAACTRQGVWLSIVPDLLTEPTAELALGLAIGLARHVRRGDALVREGHFEGWRPQLFGTGLMGSTVAVIGLGKVGSAIIDRLQGFACREVLGVDALATHPAARSVSLDTALAQADYVFLALPLTPDSIHLINAARLQTVKPGQLLINVGRGSVVDEQAVLAALQSGRLAGYAADVFECEDWALPERPAQIAPALLARHDTLFTPHLGSAVSAVRRAIEHRAADNILALLRGEMPPDAINQPQRGSIALRAE